MVGELGRPEEVVAAGDGVHGADGDLHADQHHPLPRHRDAPVVRAVVDHEQLKRSEERKRKEDAIMHIHRKEKE